MKGGAPGPEPVLVMDRDELVRWSAAEGLREHGYHVEVAASSHEALERCRDATVALLDHDDRGFDGLALAETLRARCPRCAIVLMAAELTPELLRDARERRIVQVLEKPFSLEDLVAVIGRARAHHADVPPRRAEAKREVREELEETETSRGV